MADMSRPDPYAALDRFSTPARHSADIGRIFVMLVGLEVIFAVTNPILMAVLPTWFIDGYLSDNTVIGTAFGFAMFGFILCAFRLLVKYVHGRGLNSMTGPWVDAKADYWVTLKAVCIILFAMAIAPPWGGGPAGITMTIPALWLLTLPLALAVITLQAGTEEIIYRGYLQQQFAVLSGHPAIWMVIPSFIFGFGHYLNGYGAADGLYWALWATLLGLSCADLTARTGNIGAAVGLHVANNMFASVIGGMDGMPSSGFALFLYPYDDPWQYEYGLDQLWNLWVLGDFITSALGVLIMWLAARIAIKR